MPLFVAVGFVVLLGVLPTNLIGVIATSLSIFTALLLNLLLLAYNITRSSESPSDEGIREMREKLFHEIFSNIAFAVLVALGGCLRKPLTGFAPGRDRRILAYYWMPRWHSVREHLCNSDSRHPQIGDLGSVRFLGQAASSGWLRIDIRRRE